MKNTGPKNPPTFKWTKELYDLGQRKYQASQDRVTLERLLKCGCGGWVEVNSNNTRMWYAWCTTCLRGYEDYHPDPVAALVAFHEGRKG